MTTRRDNPTGPFQNIPVPNEHVPAVLAYLGSLLTGASGPEIPLAARTEAPKAESSEAVEDDWSDEELERFFALGTKYSEITEQVLRHLAEHPGKAAAVTTSELAEALSIKYSEMKILPTQVKRTLRTHFSGVRPPWSAFWGPDDTPPRSDDVYFWSTKGRAEQLSRLDKRQAK